MNDIYYIKYVVKIKFDLTDRGDKKYYKKLNYHILIYLGAAKMIV